MNKGAIILVAVIAVVIIVIFIQYNNTRRQEIAVLMAEQNRLNLESQVEADIECSKNWLCGSTKFFQQQNANAGAFMQLWGSIWGFGDKGGGESQTGQ